MKKVFKFVKGKKEERKECGGITPSQSGELISPAQTPEDEAFLGPENSTGYAVDFGGKDKTLTKLHKAAWQGNLEKLKSALKKVDVDAVDKRNRTALHFAVAQGHPNIVWFLLGNNANTSIADDDGHTPLLKAIECGHRDCTNLLLDRGADVNVSDYAGNTGLHLAVDRVSLDTAAALIRKNADTDVTNNAGDYPMHIATRLENKDLVALLLNAGASVDVQDRENRTPLMLAAKTGNSFLTKTLVEHGAQLSLADSNGWTAHDYAMLGGHESVSASLKTSAKNVEERTRPKMEDSDLDENDDQVGSWGDSQTEASEKEPITQKLKKMFEKCSEDEGAKEKNEDTSESPDADAIPPYCQPPRSWEMIQAGMIDENKNRIVSKRRSITTLGTLHSRRESFTEGSAPSPQFTLSLNRRRPVKGNNDFAKQRFSFNEEESLRYWLSEEKTAGKNSERVEVGNMVTLQEMRDPGRGRATAESDWDSASEEKSHSSQKAGKTSRDAEGEGEQDGSSGRSESGTLGRAGTMREVEEVWVSCPRSSPSGTLAGMERNNSWDSEDASSEKEGSFPPPPTALELGIDMARSIKFIKGMSVDRPPGCVADKNLWRNVHERHSLDCLEERDFSEIYKRTAPKAHGKSTAAQNGEEILRSLKPTDRFGDVNKRINQELECYDQALRELAETSGKREKFPSQNYHSLPSIKTGGDRECRRANSQELTADASSRHSEGPNSLPLLVEKCNLENNERLGPEFPQEKAGEKKPKRHMLLAMRDVKHAVHVTNSFKTSLDDQILSPLTKEDFDSGDEDSAKGPLEENPFFGIGRQETVLERNGTRRKSSSSGTGEESTLWLQDDSRKKGPQCPESDDDVSEIAADERWKHQSTSSFSPLGLIHKEMEEESRRSKTSARAGPSVEAISNENEERREEIFREQSPDVSLSSGPIEPIGAEKDSGSEPESSHNEVSPTHHYAVKNQHEWLKCHLKAATAEKSKLEELTAQLTEKAERLQYELADAREAAKSRDEVIRLLQGQLARMEAAYTKSLEESVQSRLQLTSHEQEILHLKELCFRYEEEKEATEAGARSDFLDELKSRVKMLEEEKEKMREEITHLEEEKCLLEKRLKRGKKEEAEMIDECQRWKERCEKLEEMAKTYESRQTVSESLEAGRAEQESIRQKVFQLEKKCLELSEENVQLKAKVQCLSVELNFERKKASACEEKQESISEMKRKTVDMQMKLKKIESEMEENLVKRLKEKEGEVEGLVKQFNRERDSLVAAYEYKLKEERSGQSRPDADDPEIGTRRLKQVVESLKDQMILEQMRMSASVESVHEALKVELSRLKGEWDSVSKAIAESRKDTREMKPLVVERAMPCGPKGKSTRREEETEGVPRGFPNPCDVKRELLDLKTQVLSLRELLECYRWPWMVTERQRGPSGKKRGVGVENELAWSSLYGMNRIPRRERTGRSATPIKDGDVEGSSEENVSETKKRRSSKDITKNYEREMSEKCQKLEFLELKKEILSLQSRMLDEKNLRHALENQMIKMNFDLSNKDNLEKEVNSLKKKVEDREYLRSSEMELIQYEKDLEAKREKYLSGWEGVTEGANDDYKAKCQVLAKEREKSKRIRDSLGRKAKSFECAPLEGSPRPKFHSCPSRPERFLQPRFMALDPEIKHKLETKLDNSIRKYVQRGQKTLRWMGGEFSEIQAEKRCRDRLLFLIPDENSTLDADLIEMLHFISS